MKKLVISTILLLLSLFGFSQNEGISNENAVIKIEYRGYESGNYKFLITNKQSCAISAQYNTSIDKTIIDISIQGLGTYELLVAASNSTVVYADARTRSFCPTVSPDQGWVEASSLQSPLLPIKFKSVSARRLDSKTIRLTFESEEDNTIKLYKVMVSFDSGKTFVEKNIVFPNGVQGSKIYTVTVKL